MRAGGRVAQGHEGVGVRHWGLMGSCPLWPLPIFLWYFGVKVVGCWCVLSRILILQPAKEAEATLPP